jgi:hypothetical protein
LKNSFAVMVAINMSPLVMLVMLVISFPLLTFAATTDTTCVVSCSTWSVVLGYCRGIYGNVRESAQSPYSSYTSFSVSYRSGRDLTVDAAQQKNLTFGNAFLSCLCVGSEASGAIGNTTFLSDASICQGCSTTPPRIQSDLSVSIHFTITG